MPVLPAWKVVPAGARNFEPGSSGDRLRADPSVQAMQGGQGAFYTSNEWVIDVGLDRLA